MYQIIQDPATGNFCLFDTKKGKTTATAPAASDLHRRAARASIKYPELASRLWNAAEIAAAGKVKPTTLKEQTASPSRRDQDWPILAHVESQEGEEVYIIRRSLPHHLSHPAAMQAGCELTCNCDDFRRGRAQFKKQTVCKHVLACFLQSWRDASPQPPAAAPLAEAKAPAKLPRDMIEAERAEWAVQESINRQRNLSNGSNRWRTYREIAEKNGQAHLMPNQSGRFTR